MARTVVPLIAVLGLVGACDSAVGIPSEQSATTGATSASESTVVATTTDPPSILPGPPVGEVPGNAAAAAALRPFVNDLIGGGIGVVTTRCWTVPPTDIPAMYFDTAAILDAVAAPGFDGQFAVTWTGPVSTVSVKRSEIASGYACPSVYPTGTSPVFDAADAAYRVDRYLGRLAGLPVNPDDVENNYPLICDSRPIWDPAAIGSPTVPPLNVNPALLPSITSFEPDSVREIGVSGDYTRVNADIVDATGTFQNRTFVLAIGGEGYCIGDIL